MIGTIGFESWSTYHHRIDIAYEMNPDYWRRGIATMAVKKACQFAFEHLMINRIEAYVLPSNTPSMALLEKLEFTFEGTLKEYRRFKGKFTDVSCLSLTHAEYIKHQSMYEQLKAKVKRL